MEESSFTPRPFYHRGKNVSFVGGRQIVRKILVRFQILTTTNMNMPLFWDVASYSLVEIYRRFRYALCIPGNEIITTICTSETSVTFYQTVRRNVPEERHAAKDLALPGLEPRSSSLPPVPKTCYNKHLSSERSKEKHAGCPVNNLCHEPKSRSCGLHSESLFKSRPGDRSRWVTFFLDSRSSSRTVSLYKLELTWFVSCLPTPPEEHLCCCSAPVGL
jgi:hypothetical protein